MSECCWISQRTRPPTDGVRRAGRNEDGVARAHGNAFEAVLGGAVLDGASKFFGGDAGLEADAALRRPRARAGRTTFPSCRRAGARARFVARGVVVVGMDLHGKLLLGEDEFYEQREVMGEICVAFQPTAAAIRARRCPIFRRQTARRRSGTRCRSSRLRREARPDSISPGKAAREKARPKGAG